MTDYPEYEPLGTRFLRTDVRYMSKRDLFLSSLQFGGAGVIGLGLMWALALLAFGDPNREPSVAVIVINFGLSIFTGMGLAGALYLLVRAWLRSPAYDPREVWRIDVENAEKDEPIRYSDRRGLS